MCNCGNKRSEYRKANLPQQSRTTPAPANPAPAKPAPVVVTNAKIKFMYTGRASLKIVGDKSGRLYNFRIRGEMLEVSPDDSSTMMNHPELKMVRG